MTEHVWTAAELRAIAEARATEKVVIELDADTAMPVDIKDHQLLADDPIPMELKTDTNLPIDIKDHQLSADKPIPVGVEGFGRVDTTPVDDPEQEAANLLGLIRGIYRQARGGSVSNATKSFSLTGNPGPGQMLSFGDGTVSHSFEYVATLDGYAGVNIPILLGADAVETQANTSIAFDTALLAPRAQVSLEALDATILLTALVPGELGIITLGVPSEVGVAGDLVPGVSAMSIRDVMNQTAMLNAKIDRITSGDTPAVATLSGSSVSIEERLWLSTDPDPVPVSNRALGVVIDVATNEMTTKYWDGASWEEVR